MIEFSFPLCSKNQLGAAGAAQLAKGNWPALRILDIGWEMLAWPLDFEQRTTSIDWHAILS